MSSLYITTAKQMPNPTIQLQFQFYRGNPQIDNVLAAKQPIITSEVSKYKTQISYLSETHKKARSLVTQRQHRYQTQRSPYLVRKDTNLNPNLPVWSQD